MVSQKTDFSWPAEPARPAVQPVLPAVLESVPPRLESHTAT